MRSGTATEVNVFLGPTLSAKRFPEQMLTLLANPLVISNRNCGLFGKENIVPVFLKLQLQGKPFRNLRKWVYCFKSRINPISQPVKTPVGICLN